MGYKGKAMLHMWGLRPEISPGIGWAVDIDTVGVKGKEKGGRREIVKAKRL